MRTTKAQISDFNYEEFHIELCFVYCFCLALWSLRLGGRKLDDMSRLMIKPTEWLCARRRLRLAWVSAHTDQSLRCPYEESLGPLLATERTAKTLIRLGGCPGWSESSLGAHSFCWFCQWGGSYVFVYFVWVTSCLFLGLAAACDYGTSWTFHLIFWVITEPQLLRIDCFLRSHHLLFKTVFLIYLLQCLFFLSWNRHKTPADTWIWWNNASKEVIFDNFLTNWLLTQTKHQRIINHNLEHTWL